MIATKPITYSREYAARIVEHNGRLWCDEEPLPILPPAGFDSGELVITYETRHVYHSGDWTTPPLSEVELTPTGCELRSDRGAVHPVSEYAEVACWELFSGRIYERELSQ